jgi:hypothetical protein
MVPGIWLDEYVYTLDSRADLTVALAGYIIHARRDVAIAANEHGTEYYNDCMSSE